MLRVLLPNRFIHREVVKNAIENRDISDNVLQSLVQLLGKDSKGVTPTEIADLASVIFDSVKEEVDKA